MAFLFRRHRYPKEPEPASAPQPSKQQDDDLVPPPPLTAATTAASIEGSEKLPEQEQPPMPAATGDERVPVTDDNEAVEALDLCFAVDCTGSMASYIAAAQRNIIAIVEGIARTERVGVRFGLVCYRDHPPQEATYVTRVFQFTADVAEMKAYVDTMAAVGGGDGPEAVADALYEVLRMEFRPNAAKVCVLIADAPPHGLGEACDGFPQGCPAGHDPLTLARQCAQRGITIYSVGCEPALSAFLAAKDFLISLADITSGMALRLESSQLLAQVILGSAVEELALMRLQREVAREVQAGLEQGLSEATVVAQLEGTLRSKGTKSKQLRTTLRLHPDAAPHARAISASASMAEARSHVTRAAEAAAGRGDSGGGGPALMALRRSASSRGFVSRDGSMDDDTCALSSCCSSPTAAPMLAAAASAMYVAAASMPPPPPPPSATRSGFGPLISGLLSRRGGAHHAPAMERGSSWGAHKWMAAAAGVAVASGPVDAADMAAAGMAGLAVTESKREVEVCEEAEVSIDQIQRLVRKAKSLRGDWDGGAEAEEGKEDCAPVLSGLGVASAKTL